MSYHHSGLVPLVPTFTESGPKMADRPDNAAPPSIFTISRCCFGFRDLFLFPV